MGTSLEPTKLLEQEALAFLLLLAAVIAYKLLTRQISLNGVLTKGGSFGASPERIQLLLATLAVSGKVLSGAMHGTTAALPDVSHAWVYGFGASGGIYASVKALRSITNQSSTRR